jgi:aspartyl-tRNA(Asn)/glutamyl-tRNA(Gln) amidotransferase subunit A
MRYRSLEEVRADLKKGQITVLELTRHYLKNIHEKDAALNAFLEVYEDEAIARAREIDRKISEGTAGTLAGLVVGLKDNICYAGHKISASSRILEGFESLFSATVTERLIQEDAIIIGRLNCDEFAMGSSNENSAFGPVSNPFDPTKVSGGSSGGSAAAVAADMCLASLGSDTGGSIRQPAAFCGLVGYKPSYGMVSRHGLIAYASSFDQIGPFTHDVSTAREVLEVISGPDAFDTTAEQTKLDLSSGSAEKKKIAFLKDCFEAKGLDPEIRESGEKLRKQLVEAGHEVQDVSFPYLDYLVPTYYVITTAEASSNLARYDGIHYGYRSGEAHDLESTYKLSRTEGFGKEVQRRIMLGTFVLSSGYYDAYFGRGQKVRRFITNKVEELFEEFDLIATPTTPHTAFDKGVEYDDPTVMYLEDIFTVLANIAGICAVTLPLGQHSNGLPFGMQFMGPRFKDGELLDFSEELMNK